MRPNRLSLPERVEEKGGGSREVDGSRFTFSGGLVVRDVRPI